jgi:DNA-binding GntR family transcriptional regulator
MLQPLATPPDLVARVHASLLEAIVAGELAPGQRHTQEALAARLGVSRQPIIQALQRLRMQGLIVDTPNRRGVEVAPLDARFLAWLYELRAALDAAAAGGAARARRPELRRPGAAIIAQGRAALAGQDAAALADADERFHLFVYEACGNPMLLDTARQHWHHTRRAMRAHIALAETMRNVWDEHAAILDAIVSGDAARASRLSHDHATNSAALLAAAPAASRQPIPQRRPR